MAAIIKIDSEPQYQYDKFTSQPVVTAVWDYAVLTELHETSGTLVLPMPEIAPGDRFAEVPIEVTGVPFAGLLQHWSGVAAFENSQRLSSAGVWESSATGEQGYILDLGGMWPVLELRTGDLGATITCVVPWLGTDFAPASLYPAHTGSTPSRAPDSTGTAVAALRGVQSQKLYVQLSTGVSVADLLEKLIVVSGVYPRNLRARIDTGDVFWTHAGELRGQTVITLLNESLNALAREISTKVTPNLVIESDAPGVILPPASPFEDLVAQKGAEASWAGEPGTDVPIEAGEDIAVPLIFTDDGSGKGWIARSLRIHGRYDASPWRLQSLQSEDSQAAPMGLVLDAHFSAARRFTLTHEAELHGVSLQLAGEEKSGLLLELMGEKDGLPSGEVLASAELPLEADPGGSWREALFAEPLVLASAQSFWVLLKAREGSARWLAVAAEASDSRYSEEGGAWSAFPEVYRSADGSIALPQATLRLLRLPYAEESDALLTISLPVQGGGALELAWDRRKQAEPMEWKLPLSNPPELPPPAGDAGRTWEAAVTSQAGGTLELERVELFYELKP